MIFLYLCFKKWLLKNIPTRDRGFKICVKKVLTRKCVKMWLMRIGGGAECIGRGFNSGLIRRNTSKGYNLNTFFITFRREFCESKLL